MMHYILHIFLNHHFNTTQFPQSIFSNLSFLLVQLAICWNYHACFSFLHTPSTSSLSMYFLMQFLIDCRNMRSSSSLLGNKLMNAPSKLLPSLSSLRGAILLLFMAFSYVNFSIYCIVFLLFSWFIINILHTKQNRVY